MTTRGEIPGATTLRLARQHLSPAVVLDLARTDVFGLLGTEPLARFTTTIGALIDQALDDALTSTPSEVVPTGPTAGRSDLAPLVPRSAIDRSPVSGSVVAGPTRAQPGAPTRTATADIVSRSRASRRDRHSPVAAVIDATADAATVQPTSPAPRRAALRSLARAATNTGAAPSVAATDEAATREPEVSPAAWARRVAALGAVTPVVIEPVPTHQPGPLEQRVDRRRPDPTATDDHHRGLPPRVDLSATDPRRPERHDSTTPGSARAVAPSEPVGRSQLAGLARWWNETHGSNEPSPIDEFALPTTTPTPGETSTRWHRTSQRSFDTTGSDDLRSAFHGLLEEALLTEARADGIEVRP